MKKKTNSISTFVVSAITLLICLFCTIVGSTNSWFMMSSYSPGIQVQIDIRQLQLKVYQGSVSSENEITVLSEADDNIVLSGKIVPGVAKNLTLILKNEDTSSNSLYVRFKFELFAISVDENGDATTTIVPCTLSGFTAPAGANNGFVLSGGYYYYQNSSGNNVKFTSNSQATMLTSFTVPVSSFASSGLNGNETLKIVLTVEGAVSTSF